MAVLDQVYPPLDFYCSYASTFNSFFFSFLKYFWMDEMRNVLTSVFPLFPCVMRNKAPRWGWGKMSVFDLFKNRHQSPCLLFKMMWVSVKLLQPLCHARDKCVRTRMSARARACVCVFVWGPVRPEAYGMLDYENTLIIRTLNCCGLRLVNYDKTILPKQFVWRAKNLKIPTFSVNWMINLSEKKLKLLLKFRDYPVDFKKVDIVKFKRILHPTYFFKSHIFSTQPLLRKKKISTFGKLLVHVQLFKCDDQGSSLLRKEQHFVDNP